MYNVCLRPDNENFAEAEEIEKFSKAGNYRYEHKQRRWEYGLAVRFFREMNPKTVLNVGGGNSPLSSFFVKSGAKVTEIDPGNVGQDLFTDIEYIFEPFPSRILGKYDLVVCTSVIEHIEKEDLEFFDELLNHSNKAVFITTDFHPSGKPLSYFHYRTYNAMNMFEMMSAARVRSFMPYGSIYYNYVQPMVFDYTFAALALRKRD